MVSRLQFDPAREEQDLRRYLGGAFDLARLQRYQEQLDEEFAGCNDEATFYRTSTGYLYNLAAFAMTGTKLPYLEALARQVEPPARLLDYGCGIGSDGLMLLEAGYRVEFADFENPSTDYLRWRLRDRGLEAPVHDLSESVPPGFDAVYAFDVAEHVPDPFAFIAELEQRGRLVEINLLEPEPGEQELHHELPVTALLRRISHHRIRYYRVLHGRSHLVLYEAGPATWRERAVSGARLGAGQLRHRAGRRVRGHWRRGRAAAAA